MAHDTSELGQSHLPYPRSPARSYDSSASPNTSPGLYNPLPPIQRQPGEGRPMGYSMAHSTFAGHSRQWPPYQTMPEGRMPPPLGHENSLPSIGSQPMGQDPRYGGHSGMPRPPSAPHSSSTSLGGALGKRAYRQRRKDPSCDACRERKVKCDATESMSCSECTSRNVKCQFTKDTNRRMSSMKQVQDLMNQTTELKNENAILLQQLREQGRGGPRAPGSDMDVDHEPGSVSIGSDGGQWADHDDLGGVFGRGPLPGVNAQSRRKRPISTITNIEAREFAQRYSAGVWKKQKRADGQRWEWAVVSQSACQEMVAAYLAHVNYLFPVHAAGVYEGVERICDDADKKNALVYDDATDKKSSLVYAVLAAGSLFVDQPGGYRFRHSAEMLDRARELIDPWEDEFTLPKVQTLALVAFCLGEMNLRAAAWVTVGKAVRAAQELGLHLEDEGDDEMRRRTWWGIYVLERSLAAEMGRRSAIDDDECDVALPATDDEAARLLPIIDTARVYGPLLRALGSRAIRLMATLDQRLDEGSAFFASSAEYSLLSPSAVLSQFHALGARLLLHRHALASPSPDVRLAAAQQCVHVSSTTAQLLVRLSGPLAESATSHAVLHMFRSAAVLLWTGSAKAAAKIIRELAVIGDRRDVAPACGRFLAAFLGVVSRKRNEFVARVVAQYSHRGSPSEGALDEYAAAQVQGLLLQDEELGGLITGDIDLNKPIDVKDGDIKGKGNSGDKLYSIASRTGMDTVEAPEWTSHGPAWERLEGAVRKFDAEGQKVMPVPGWFGGYAAHSPPSHEPPQTQIQVQVQQVQQIQTPVQQVQVQQIPVQVQKVDVPVHKVSPKDEVRRKDQMSIANII